MIKNRNYLILISIKVTIFIFINISTSFSETFSLSENKTLIGHTSYYKIKGNESLIEIARKFKLGYNEITEANPSLDPFIPGDGAEVIIPSSWVLPEVKIIDGIIINLSEMRLYYFFKKDKKPMVMTFPIGIGSEGNDTPTGTFKIIEKIEKPKWVVPESIRKENPRLPAIVPPGPENPLGNYALRLSLGSILIHGTNRPYAVGRKASHGCIRLYPEDIPILFHSVNKNTIVNIVRQPVKVGLYEGKILLEVHKDNTLKINYFNEAAKLLKQKNLYDKVDKIKMIETLHKKNGIPTDITK